MPPSVRPSTISRKDQHRRAVADGGVHGQTLSTQAVLPMAGRAATTIRFSGCRPAVISSSRVNPVGTPVTWRRFVERASQGLDQAGSRSPTRR